MWTPTNEFAVSTWCISVYIVVVVIVIVIITMACLLLRCIKDWYAAAEPSCYVLRPIVYIVGCLCKLIFAASCACVCKSICSCI